MEILIVYLILSGILFILVSFYLIGYGISRDSDLNIMIGAILLIFIGVMFPISLEDYYKSPKAIEVYQGKTTLRSTVIDSVRVDSVVIYKEK